MRSTTALVCVAIAACGSPAAPQVAKRAPALPKIATKPPPPDAYLAGSRIVATADGALIADEDSGSLVALDGRAIAIGRGLGQLVYDPDIDRAYVVDRRGDRVAVVDAKRFAIVASYHTPAEPFGIALTPDRKSVLVTTIADRTLVALDAATGAEKWRTKISPGARGIAASPNGDRAVISSIATETIDLVELTDTHRIATVPYNLYCSSCDLSNAFARGTGAIRFLDDNRVVATFQRSIPESLQELVIDRYSGAAHVPITQHVAFFTFHEHSADEMVAQLAENQPRSIAWDAARSALFISGHGSSSIIALPHLTADASKVEDSAQTAMLHSDDGCGPDGLALDGDGGLYVWCAFTRTVLRIDAPTSLDTAQMTSTQPLVASAFTPDEHRGRVLFESTSMMVNRDNALACTTCHVDGLSDGLSWKVGSQPLQTPVLAGRLDGTAPYRWDGSAPTLEASLASTIKRLGGDGFSASDTAAVLAYLRSLPRPRAPTARDPAAAVRGKALFENEAGCTTCHDGDSYSDGDQHEFEGSLKSANTPSLVGVAISAPYYHDGSARTLHELLQGGGYVHGMSDDLGKLSKTQLADLEAFLQTL